MDGVNQLQSVGNQTGILVMKFNLRTMTSFMGTKMITPQLVEVGKTIRRVSLNIAGMTLVRKTEMEFFLSSDQMAC